MSEELSELKRRIEYLERKVEELINAHNKHRHRIIIIDESDYSNHLIKKEDFEK